MGWDFLAAHPPMPIEDLVANINIDMPMALTPTTDLIARAIADA